MSPDEPITTLIFDAYGTLFDVYSVESTAEELYPGFGASIAHMWRQKQMEYMWLRSLMQRYEDFEAVTEASFRYTCNALDLRCDSAIAKKMMDVYLHLSPVPEALEALDALSGFRRAILSNGTPTGLAQLVQNAGLGSRFDKVISVHELRIYKPHPAVYELAARELGAKASQVGFVSSNFWDVSGAASYGFRVFWINRRNALPDPLGFAPSAVLARLTELPDVVARENARVAGAERVAAGGVG